MPKGIYKRKPLTEEHKKNIGISVLGEKNGFYNKVHSKETRSKMKEKWKSRKESPDYKQKMKERGSKQSDSMKVLWNEGVYDTEEYRKSLSKGVIEVWKDPNSKFNSKEWRELQRKNALEQFKDPVKLKNYIDGTRRQPNKQENFLTKLIGEIFSKKFEYVGDSKVWIDGKNPDWISKDKKVIEFFGRYWHKDEDEKERKVHFGKNGYKCLVIWEEELKDIFSLSKKIKTFGGHDE